MKKLFHKPSYQKREKKNWIPRQIKKRKKIRCFFSYFIVSFLIFILLFAENVDTFQMLRWGLQLLRFFFLFSYFFAVPTAIYFYVLRILWLYFSRLYILHRQLVHFLIFFRRILRERQDFILFYSILYIYFLLISCSFVVFSAPFHCLYN